MSNLQSKTAPDLPHLGGCSQPTYYKATLMVSDIHKERKNCPPLPYAKKCNKCQDIWIGYKQNGLLCACNCFSIAGKSFHNPNVYIPLTLMYTYPTDSEGFCGYRFQPRPKKLQATDQTLQSTPGVHNCKEQSPFA